MFTDNPYIELDGSARNTPAGNVNSLTPVQARLAKLRRVVELARECEHARWYQWAGESMYPELHLERRTHKRIYDWEDHLHNDTRLT